MISKTETEKEEIQKHAMEQIHTYSKLTQFRPSELEIHAETPPTRGLDARSPRSIAAYLSPTGGKTKPKMLQIFLTENPRFLRPAALHPNPSEAKPPRTEHSTRAQARGDSAALRRIERERSRGREGGEPRSGWQSDPHLGRPW